MNASNSLRRVLRTALTVVLSFALFAGGLSAQNANVSLSAKGISIENALGMLKTDYGYSFVMRTEGLDLSKKVTVSVTDVPVETAVTRIFAPTAVTVDVKKNVVYISSMTQRPVKSRTVTGVVLDANDQPVIGAAVLTGANTGTTTDENGRFSLSLPNEDTDIEVSCLGYDTKRFSIRGGRVLSGYS